MRSVLKTFDEEVTLVVDGQVFSETVEGGRIVQSYPRLIEVDGEFVKNLSGEDEKIQLFFVSGEVYRWSGFLKDYDPDTVSDNPEEEPRWVLE